MAPWVRIDHGETGGKGRGEGRGCEREREREVGGGGGEGEEGYVRESVREKMNILTTTILDETFYQNTRNHYIILSHSGPLHIQFSNSHISFHHALYM